jgi:hypothetical protein
VNYLCHFFIDEDAAKSPAFHLGLILPDISRGLVSGLGRHPEAWGDSQFNKDLNKGCAFHLAADKRFHQSAFFEHGSSYCLQKVKEIPFSQELNRKWFIGHILFEMLMDRLLVQHMPILVSRFYNNLNLIDAADLREFMNIHHCKDTQRFLRNFEHFRQAAYIANYPDNNLFAYSLSRVMMRVGLPGLNFEDKQILITGIRELEEGVFANRQALFYELKKVFE